MVLPRRLVALWSSAAAAVAAVGSERGPPPATGPSTASGVVHMVFDDFRPDLPMYGQKFVHAPNLEAFANRSLVFDRAYCQIAVCSPSRNSFMTGRRPNSTLVWNFFNSFREAQCPDTTVGEYLEGTPIVGLNWTEADGQQSGGAGGCCTSCTGRKECKAWSYRGVAGEQGGTCTTFSEVTKRIPCGIGGAAWWCDNATKAAGMCDARGHTLSCISGTRGAFPKFTSLPEHFKNHGYLTMGVGKLFHDGGFGFGGAPDDLDHPAGPGTPPLADPLSWSNSSTQYPQGCKWTPPSPLPPDPASPAYGQGWAVECPGLPKFINSYPPNSVQAGSAYFTPAGQGTCHDVPPGPFANPGPSGCTEDVPDNGEGPDVDGQIHGRPPMLDLPVYKNAITKLQFAAKNLKETKQKFFLNVGIKRPHLVWRVPVGIIREHYHPDSFTPALPQNRVLDPSVNPVAWVPFFDHNPYTPRSVNETLELRRYYYAAITWADWIAGQVLDEIETLELQASTVVVIHADHGWHLGEYNMWEKRTIWELGTRVPYMIHVPWLTASHGQHTAGLTELIDTYPTLCDIMGLPQPSQEAFPLEGVSLRPLLEDPTLKVLPSRDFALSTYARCPQAGEEEPTPHGARTVWNTECIHDTERSAFKFMGYTIRTDEYRYTEFVRWNGSSLSPIWSEVESRELYDHRLDIPGTATWEAKDDFEDVNIAPGAEPALLAKLASKLRAAFGDGGRPALGGV